MREQVVNRQRLMIQRIRSIIDRQFCALPMKHPKEMVVRRYMLAALLREFTDLSLKEIELEVGIDHATVVYGLFRIRHHYLYHPFWGRVVSVCLVKAERLSNREIRIKGRCYELA